MGQGYRLGNYEFKVEEFFPEKIFNRITDIRVEKREIIKEEAKNRRRRKKLSKDGKLTILAADHPGRRITSSGVDPLIMGNRQEYLGRVLRVITDEEFDGVMGTPDVLEDLFIVNYLVKQNGGKGFLDGKVMLGCMNRGGLKATAFEMDDRFTAWTAESIKEMNLDGAKLMFRLEPSEEASGKTISYCARAITELNKYDIPAFVEPLPVDPMTEGFSTRKVAEELIKTNGVATALGDSSRGIWLKIPYCENFELVAKSTTCPILMLGGASRGDPTPILEQFSKGMRSGANVRGVLVGRNVLFPGKEGPQAVASAVNRIVHQEISAKQAIEHLMEIRGRNMDFLTRYFS